MPTRVFIELTLYLYLIDGVVVSSRAVALFHIYVLNWYFRKSINSKKKNVISIKTELLRKITEYYIIINTFVIFSS